MRPDSPIGVFDSGVGGLSILRALRAELPDERFVYFSDAGHAPYGERSADYVTDRTLTIAQGLRERHGIKALVIACNTATTCAVHRVRESHPEWPVVGVEPALKPAAALTRTRRVAVFATRGTLASAKYALLHDSLKELAEFIPQPCDGLAAAIENDDEDRVRELCERYAAASGPFGDGAGQIDTLVLGCTHYPFALPHLAHAAGPRVQFVETGVPVSRQARRLLAAKALLNDAGAGAVQWETSGDPQALRSAAGRWLGL